MKLLIKILFSLSVLVNLNVVFADSLFNKIKTKGTVIIATEGTYAPFSYYDKNGKLTGYDVEIARAVGKQLGIHIVFKQTQWDAMLAGLNSQRFDVVANQVGLTTAERRAKYDSSSAYSYSGAVAVMRKDSPSIDYWQAIKGLKSAQSLSSNYSELAKKHGATLVAVDGLAQALQLVKQRRVDLTINDNLAILDFLKKQPHAGIKIVLHSKQKTAAGFIFNKGYQQSIALFNKALEELRQDGTLQRIGEQFFGEDISVK